MPCGELTEASKFDSTVLRIEAITLAISRVSSLRWFSSKIEVSDSSPSMEGFAPEDLHGRCLNMVMMGKEDVQLNEGYIYSRRKI